MERFRAICSSFCWISFIIVISSLALSFSPVVRASSPCSGSPTGEKGREGKVPRSDQANAAERVTGVKRMARSLRRGESGNLPERPPAILKKSRDAKRIRQILVLACFYLFTDRSIGLLNLTVEKIGGLSPPATLHHDYHSFSKTRIHWAAEDGLICVAECSSPLITGEIACRQHRRCKSLWKTSR